MAGNELLKKMKYALRFVPDKLYLQIYYLFRLKKWPDFNNPETFNEKINWLKLHDRNPAYPQMVDKWKAKEYISSKIGQEYTIPTLGVWDSFDEIDFNTLPNQFVLKCTHDSGGLVIVTDKSRMNLDNVKKIINKALHCNYYYVSREWPYKYVTPRIIAEPYLVDESETELKDYKVFCFNGEPDYVEVDFNRWIEHKLNPYNFKWQPLNFCDSSKNDYKADIKKPECLNEVYNIAKKLSSGLAFLRVDFYIINNKPIVGELTLYPGGGFIRYNPAQMDLLYGKKLDVSAIQG